MSALPFWSWHKGCKARCERTQPGPEGLGPRRDQGGLGSLCPLGLRWAVLGLLVCPAHQARSDCGTHFPRGLVCAEVVVASRQASAGQAIKGALSCSRHLCTWEPPLHSVPFSLSQISGIRKTPTTTTAPSTSLSALF